MGYLIRLHFLIPDKNSLLTKDRKSFIRRNFQRFIRRLVKVVSILLFPIIIIFSILLVKSIRYSSVVFDTDVSCQTRASLTSHGWSRRRRSLHRAIQDMKLMLSLCINSIYTLSVCPPVCLSQSTRPIWPQSRPEVPYKLRRYRLGPFD